MIRISSWLLGLAALALTPLVSPDSTAKTVVPFNSTRFHYRVAYPSTWQVHEPSLAYLEIFNFPPERRAHGVVIPPRGASIRVSGPPAGISSVQEWVKHDLRGPEAAVVDRDLEVTAPARDGCSILKELVFEEEAGPEVFQRFTNIYCGTSAGPFVIVLVNWKGDPDEHRYWVVAQDVARSLRAGGGNE